MARIIVTDGDERSALAVVRSLGRKGHAVIVAASRATSLAGASRFASARIVVPDGLSAPEAFAGRIGEAVRTHRCDLVIPVTDAAALALLAHRDDLEPARVPLPPLETFQRISDKAEVASTAESLGIRVPRQLRAETRDEVRRLAAAAALRPPFVLKPARSVAIAAPNRTKHGVVHAADWATTVDRASSLPDGAFPLLIQERIVGSGIGVFLLPWRTRLAAAFAHRRIREKPPSGGVSVLCESVPLDPGLRARSEALLAHYDWSGVAMIEYKLDAATGEPYLMEINGRFWGSLQLAIDAGVDFPALLVDLALGEPVTPVTQWKTGIRGRWFWGDADHALARLRRSANALHLPPDSPSTLSALFGFLRGMVPPWHDQVIRLGDAGPAIRELTDRLRGGAALAFRAPG